jgi:nicotinamidase-related amidase
MPSRDLHGNAPDHSPVALLMVDVINDMDFPEGEQLLKHALPMADRLAALKQRAAAAGVPVVYANDNFGRWRSDFRAQVKHCLGDGCRGRPVAERLRPDEDDYFVLKPKHSAFYHTALELLLKHLGTRTLVVTGLAGNICVLFTASDAYLRDLRLVVPADCTASNTEAENRAALDLMAKLLKADVRPAGEWTFEEMAKA